MLVNPDNNFAVVGPDGRMTQEFFLWMVDVTEAVNNLPPLTGSGTPEGAIAASVGRWYVDTSAGAGSGLYFKESGDGSTGWVARS